MFTPKDHHYDWKIHLRNLPNVSQFPSWQGSSKFACLVIPVFSFDHSTEHIESYVAKSAAWSLKTWKENSDAILFGIPCFIYLEDTIADAAYPILRENGVPDDSIRVAGYNNTERLAKCLQPIFDDSLSQYKYMLVSDTDMFVLKGQNGDRFPIVDRIRKHLPSGVGCKLYDEKIPHYWQSHFANLSQQMGKHVEEDVTSQWFGEVSELLDGKDIRMYYDGGKTHDRPWTAVMAIESNAFDESSKRFIQEASCVLGDDEAVICAWMHSSEASDVWDIQDGLDLSIYIDFYSYLWMAYQESRERYDPADISFQNVGLYHPILLHHYASHEFKFANLLQGG